jgi:hypothetical protein
MKETVLTGIATLALALGAFAQGTIDLDNSKGDHGVYADNYFSGTYAYSGTYGMEVWELSGVTSVPAGINLPPIYGGTGMSAYHNMMADAFKKEATFADQTMLDGTFALGQVTLPDVTPAGSTVVLALAVWNNSAPSWGAGAAQGNFQTGVVAFLNPTANPGTVPLVTPPALTGWTGGIGDLVLTPSPEPDALALAGLGVATVLVLRRRR